MSNRNGGCADEDICGGIVESANGVGGGEVKGWAVGLASAQETGPRQIDDWLAGWLVRQVGGIIFLLFFFVDNQRNVQELVKILERNQCFCRPAHYPTPTPTTTKHAFSTSFHIESFHSSFAGRSLFRNLSLSNHAIFFFCLFTSFISPSSFFIFVLYIHLFRRALVSSLLIGYFANTAGSIFIIYCDLLQIHSMSGKYYLAPQGIQIVTTSVNSIITSNSIHIALQHTMQRFVNIAS